MVPSSGPLDIRLETTSFDLPEFSIFRYFIYLVYILMYQVIKGVVRCAKGVVKEVYVWYNYHHYHYPFALVQLHSKTAATADRRMIRLCEVLEQHSRVPVSAFVTRTYRQLLRRKPNGVQTACECDRKYIPC